MLLGKGYYDIQSLKGVKKASKGTSFTSLVIYLCCLYLEQPDSKSSIQLSPMLVIGWVRGAGAVWRSARLVHLLSVVCWGEQEQASIKPLR